MIDQPRCGAQGHKMTFAEYNTRKCKKLYQSKE
jgi:hypothetical protein